MLQSSLGKAKRDMQHNTFTNNDSSISHSMQWDNGNDKPCSTVKQQIANETGL